MYFSLLKKIRNIIILTLLCTTALAQGSPDVLLSQISEENGLSDNHVQCVIKDKQGLVWIGTADGLNLLDGSTITTFRHIENDSISLLNNNIFSLAEDSTGNIWVGTSAGLGCFIKATKTFLSVGLPSSPYGASNIINCLATDKQNRVWCSTDGGLFMYSIQEKKVTAYYNLSAGQSDRGTNKIVSCLYGENDSLWLCTFSGLWLFNTKKGGFTRAVSANNDAKYEGLINVIFEDRKKRLWFGNWTEGLKQLDRKTGLVKGYSHLPGSPSNIVAISEMTLPGGRNVLCFNGSLTCFDVEANCFIQLAKSVSFSSYPVVERLYRSADGWFWMGSAKGLLIYNPQRQFFQHHIFNRTITSQSVNFFEWKNKLIVGGQGGDFLTAYYPDGRPANSFPGVLKSNTTADVARSNEATLCIVKEPSGAWLIANSGGLLRYQPEGGARQWFSHNQSDTTSLPRNFIQHLFIDSKGGYWIFPWRSGIYKMNPVNGKCGLLCKGFISGESGTKGLLIADAAEDAQSNIWMADLDEGIIFYNRNTDQFSKPFEKQIGSRMHSSRVIYRNGFCYSFADEHLLKWNTGTQQLQVIELPLQLRSNIRDLVLDAQDRWWIATKKGLLAYTDATHTFQRFTTADGLLSNDLDATLFVKNNGQIIIGTPAYFTTFNPEELLGSSIHCSAKLMITGIEANGVQQTYDSARPIQLSYTDNNLVFKWALTDYANPFHNQYYCRLQGLDADWKYVGNKGEMQYANLSPGTYTLLLKASTANGIAANKVIEVRFKITPPFWKAAWFWASLFIVVAFTVYWLISRRIKSIKTKAAISQQLSALELKALKAQMNPHFIFNSLSSIQESIVNNKTEAASKYLGKFSKLIRSVLENSDKKLITLQQEIDYLTLYLELESFRFDDFSFSVKITGIDDISFIKIPAMLVQPYVENAIKHGLSHKKGIKRLTIVFKEHSRNVLQVIIHDDGIGRERSAEINQSRPSSHQSMGMKITEERLKLQFANVLVPVLIEDMKNERGEAAGTCVTLYLLIEE